MYKFVLIFIIFLYLTYDLGINPEKYEKFILKYFKKK